VKYRHVYHAGNFADVHKHVTLLALLAALKRKEKGFLYLETHAGRGAYDLAAASGESSTGIGRLQGEPPANAVGGEAADELRDYLERVALLRRERGAPRHFYPGSPLLAVSGLRPQDRAVLIERVPAEARALQRALPQSGAGGRVRIETGDGFALLRAWLPPPERRGLTFIDPPYEESREDFERARQAAAQALLRFPTGVVAIWYPVKDARDTAAWRDSLAGELDCELLAAELSLYPSDSRIALNGSGMLILNPPYQLGERMQHWLPLLHQRLDLGHGGGASVRSLNA
jgi:23S rRNA (adenine2030-N6)-methyltransferase